MPMRDYSACACPYDAFGKQVNVDSELHLQTLICESSSSLAECVSPAHRFRTNRRPSAGKKAPDPWCDNF